MSRRKGRAVGAEDDSSLTGWHGLHLDCLLLLQPLDGMAWPHMMMGWMIKGEPHVRGAEVVTTDDGMDDLHGL